MLSQSDYEGFHRVIHSSKYSPNDFEISAIDFVDRFQHFYADYTRVYIKYIPTGVTKTYIAGFASYWLQDLEQDIKNEVYTAPIEVLEKQGKQP